MFLNIPRYKKAMFRAVVEIAFIIFLFYSNLLMGEYTKSNPSGKTLVQGLEDVCTYKNFGIAVVAASVGFVVFEYLRERS